MASHRRHATDIPVFVAHPLATQARTGQFSPATALDESQQQSHRLVHSQDTTSADVLSSSAASLMAPYLRGPCPISHLRS